MEGVEITINKKDIIYWSIILVLIILLILSRVLGNSCGASSTNSTEEDNSPVEAEKNTSEITTTTTSTALLTPCENKVKDAGETDIDCGGSCGACKEFQSCNLDVDCETELYCFQHIKCLRPSCEDGIKNQDETNVDCGGVCKGFFWSSDDKCHPAAEPSGLLEATIDAEITKSPNSGSAVVQEVTLKFENGLGKAATASGQVFFRDVGGSVIYETPQGDEISVEDFTLNLKDGEKKTLVIDFRNGTRSTLSGIKSTEKFEIYVVLKDTVKKTTLNEITWTNGE